MFIKKCANSNYIVCTINKFMYSLGTYVKRKTSS